jgi:ribosomal protein S18 acetylase RimI-like enzyme
MRVPAWDFPYGQRVVSIREAVIEDIPGIAAVHVASWRENYVGIVDQAMIDERTVEVRIGHWTRRLAETGHVTFVASDDSAIVGFGSVQVFEPAFEGFDSYLGLLYLISRAKGLGIGRELLRKLAAELVARGCRSMALRVLRKNPARGFYERLGARVTSSALSIDADLFDDVVYVFDEVRMLL